MDGFDLVLRGGCFFDGTGAQPAIRDVGVRAGRVAAISTSPLEAEGAEVVDAEGLWVMPGLIDIHTHYDAEVLVASGLSESVRHGVTTVIFGNCSLSTVFSSPDDCADLFSRVEALPWDAVQSALNEHQSWSDPHRYVEALESRPLGPNVSAFIGHSDLRAAVMGLDRATDPDSHPTPVELGRMRAMLADALDAGFVGMSTVRSSFSKLDGVRYPSRQLPSTYASWREYRALNRVLRERGRLHQCTPNVARKAEIGKFFAQSAGRGRAPLKTTMLAAADLKADPKMIWVLTKATALLNRVMASELRWQHLPVPFEVYADGIDLVVFEEFGSGAAALNVRDVVKRGELVDSEVYRRQFRQDIERKFGPKLWHRDLYDADIVSCPDTEVIGKSFGSVAQERGIHPADAFLDLVVAHGVALRWRTTIANHRPEVLDRIADNAQIQMGFADSGAHLRNMAFYNAGLRLLRRVNESAEGGHEFLSLERAVHRLTGELGDWYGLDAGTLRLGDRADIAVIDPAGLSKSSDDYAEAPLEELGGVSRMVNRNDDAVAATIVGGHLVYRYGNFADGFGTTRSFGSFLRAGKTHSSAGWSS
ncbi:amidohydrolase family protein [Rhodococcus sp. D-46]|uniref:N-acyl-D-amino-acid deacylase family protein n=1 Tax=unclassified Rhodococcus (in: high G+C Gram-positive bacteria) TaxID=192944 RepID=UPI00071824C2|nr:MULTISPECIES: amidohydrolase family protein [unclassified Rhodococcus (in: high G+C Gram-positive bacteria)]NHE64823.1 amidohydrolase family protein [Rhodococcus sp. D-46]